MFGRWRTQQSAKHLEEEQLNAERERMSSDPASPRSPDVAPPSDAASPLSPDAAPRSNNSSPRPPDAVPSSDATSPLSPDAAPPSDATSPLSPDAAPPSDANSPLSPDATSPSDARSPLSPDAASPSNDTSPRSRNADPPSDDSSPGPPAAVLPSDVTSPLSPDTALPKDAASPRSRDAATPGDATSPSSPEASLYSTRTLEPPSTPAFPASSQLTPVSLDASTRVQFGSPDSPANADRRTPYVPYITPPAQAQFAPDFAKQSEGFYKNSPEQNPLPQSGTTPYLRVQTDPYQQYKATPSPHLQFPRNFRRRSSFSDAKEIYRRPPTRFETMNYLSQVPVVQCLQRAYGAAKTSKLTGCAVHCMELGVYVAFAPAILLAKVCDVPLLFADKVISKSVGRVVRVLSCAADEDSCDIPGCKCENPEKCAADNTPINVENQKR